MAISPLQTIIKYSMMGLAIVCITAVVTLGTIFLTREQVQKQQKRAYVPEVVLTPAVFEKVPEIAQEQVTSWELFTEEKLKLSLQHPTTVILDERQTVEGKMYVFIFAEDQEESLPGKVTALYVADTDKKGMDGFSAFRKGDCERECKISYKNASWVKINNTYGIKNPMPNDVHNYFLTDKDRKEAVVNVYVGGYIDEKDKVVQEKIKTFEQMIQTIKYE